MSKLLTLYDQRAAAVQSARDFLDAKNTDQRPAEPVVRARHGTKTRFYGN